VTGLNTAHTEIARSLRRSNRMAKGSRTQGSPWPSAKCPLLRGPTLRSIAAASSSRLILSFSEWAAVFGRAATNRLGGFKIPEQGAVGYRQTRARKWAFRPQALAPYAADSVAVAGLAWPSRVLAVRSELLEALKSLPALQGMREARRSPRQLSRGSLRQQQSNPVYACRSP
jgi:hypothetical protein